MKIPYQNEHLHAQVEKNTFGVWFLVTMELLGFYLCFLSFYNTYKDIANQNLKCTYKIFVKTFSEDHPLGFIFGLTILIINTMIMLSEGTVLAFRHMHPAHGSVKLTPKEIDDQANCKKSKWFQRQGLYFAPEILIGTQRGMAAVRYDDVEKVILKSREHINWGSAPNGSRWKTSGKYNAELSAWANSSSSKDTLYKLIVISKNHKKLTMCAASSMEDEVLDLLKERCGKEVEYK